MARDADADQKVPRRTAVRTGMSQACKPHQTSRIDSDGNLYRRDFHAVLRDRGSARTCPPRRLFETESRLRPRRRQPRRRSATGDCRFPPPPKAPPRICSRSTCPPPNNSEKNQRAPSRRSPGRPAPQLKGCPWGPGAPGRNLPETVVLLPLFRIAQDVERFLHLLELISEACLCLLMSGWYFFVSFLCALRDFLSPTPSSRLRESCNNLVLPLISVYYRRLRPPRKGLRGGRSNNAPARQGSPPHYRSARFLRQAH